MSNGFLHRYFLSNSSKKLAKWVHYFDIYERHFERFRNKKPVILEIGVADGGSLLMWKDYFGEGCKIIGVDIHPSCKQHGAEDVEVFIGSQDDPELIASILEKYPNIDIVLDDGSHMMSHMVATFNLLYDKVQPNGVYVVEDTHTCYWPEYEGGFKVDGSFMEFVKDKLDELNAVYARDAIPVTEFTRSTDSITTYDSVFVFERRRQGSRQALGTHQM